MTTSRIHAPNPIPLQHRTWIVTLAFFHALGAWPAQGEMLETLYSFQGTNGAQPQCVLVQGSNGAFYGTTRFGGTNGLGTVFKFETNGGLTTLFQQFDSKTNGDHPQCGLMRAADGNLYGTTVKGSAGPTIFRIAPDDAFSTVAAVYTNDQAIYAPLIEARDGNLYGVSSGSGIQDNVGTVFRMTPDGTITRVAAFYWTNGASPRARLLEAPDGSFYGTTYLGGTNFTGPQGNWGTVFQVQTNGDLRNVVTFNVTNGSSPATGILQASNGRLYGTTSDGGANDLGTVFELTTNGTLTTLVDFDGTNGGGPQGDLMQASDGNIYGVTVIGGISNLGTVFRIAPDGRFSTVIEFTGPNGARPVGGLMQAADGNLYGTTYRGGEANQGTIYRIAMAPAPTIALSVVRAGSDIVLRWPTNAGVSLETTTNLLSPIAWTNANESPAIFDTDFVLTNSPTSPARFYRLKGQP